MSAHTDLSMVAVSVAPSPATSGTSLGVTDANAAYLPNIYPWWGIVKPTGAAPTRSNAELVKVTAGSSSSGTTTYTIARAQGLPATTARSIIVGDDIYEAVAAQDMIDLEYPPNCSAYNSTGQTITTGTVTALTFDSEQFDTHTMHSTSSNTSRITVPSAGKYILMAQVVFDINSTGRRLFNFRKNGSDLFGSLDEKQTVSTGGYTVCKGLLIVDAAANDYFECVVYHTKGSNLDVLGNNSGNTQTSVFQVMKVAET